jgi:ring-1,2-phenylacetyl-CoA epoxidase subunit PaaE
VTSSPVEKNVEQSRMSTFQALTVNLVTAETRDTIAVTFSVPADLQQAYRYTQGQHLTLRIIVNMVEVRRSYSICSSAQENSLKIAIKLVPGGAFSSWAKENLKPGMQIDVMPPSGNFYTPLAAENRKHYLAFAAGSGITPIMSIIKTTLLSEPHSSFSLYYGNRSSSSVIFKTELAELKDRYMDRFKLVYMMSREQQDIELFNGRIDKSKCHQLLNDWITLDDIDHVFICGPQQMTQDVSQSLEAHGFPKQKIKYELFSPGVPALPHISNGRQIQGSQQCEVTVICDGAHSIFHMDKENESVLDAALREGIELRYACKGGVCATCRCKLVDGKVDMDANFALEDYEVERGFVLSCQSFPVSDKVIMDFDQDY